jgi:DNA-binding NarL/FixJ family response regulator
MHSDEAYARRAVAAGARGYITKGSSSDELFAAIEAVVGGGRYITPELAEQLVFAPPAEELPHERLSSAEMRVMLKLASGMRNKEIAEELHVDSSTVTTHRRRLLDKMGMNSDAELNRYAREHKLLD